MNGWRHLEQTHINVRLNTSISPMHFIIRSQRADIMIIERIQRRRFVCTNHCTSDELVSRGEVLIHSKINIVDRI